MYNKLSYVKIILSCIKYAI